MRNKKLIVLFSVIFAVTLLIVLSSVIFSVQNVYAYCYNSTGADTSEAVLSSHKIKKHSNIFMLNEGDVVDSVNTAVPNVKVINIEKKFPNKVYINYIELKEYVKIYADNVTYYCSNDGKILRKVDGVDTSSAAIELTIKGKLLTTDVGENFKSDNPNDINLLTSVLDSLSRLGYREDVVDLISKIDISGNVNIVLTTKTGMKWRLVGAEYMLDKMVMALSVYSATGTDALSDEQKRVGTLILTGGNPAICQYEPPPKNA